MSPHDLMPCDGALVTGADYRGLGVVRSLGRRGVPVWVLTQEEHLVGATSRYASRSIRSPADDDQEQVDFLVRLALDEGIGGWALFPTTDDAVVLAARHHQTLAKHYRLTSPPWDVLRWVCDKRQLHQLAHDLGMDQPWTFCPRDRAELASCDCPFPVILKPAMRLGVNRLYTEKAWRVDDRQSLLARYDEACTMVPPEMLMVQELVPGWGEAQFSYAALCADGQPIASIVARRTRQFPMDFGRFSTYVETVEEPHVADAAVRLLSALRFNGLVEVEFKRDPRTGQYLILDVNPRVWGWHTLSIRAGVDFPYLAWRFVRGEPVPETRARAGERWMRMSADLPVAIQEILRGRLSPRAYLQSLRAPRESAMFAWDDPAPGLVELPLLAWTLGKRALRGHGI